MRKLCSRKLLLLFCLIALSQSITTSMSVTPLTATLQITQYTPLHFVLEFNRAIKYPQFQLSKNNVEPLEYSLTNPSESPQSVYYLTSPGARNTITNLQSYQIIFNYPLNVGEGNLLPQFQIITASTSNINVDFSPAFGIIIMVMAYFACLTTILGYLMMEFIQVYIFFMFKTNNKTTIYQQFTNLLFLADPIQLPTQHQTAIQIPLSTILIQLIAPITIILGSFIVAATLKRIIGSKEKSIWTRIIYEFFTFNLFITCTKIYAFSALFNSFEWLVYMGSYTKEKYGNDAFTIGYVLAYFNIVTVFWFSYLKLYKINPKICESKESRRHYEKSYNYRLFLHFHDKIKMNNWWTRNANAVLLAKRLLYVVLFFCFEKFVYVALVFQFVHMYYIFTVRPYKEQFYTNSIVIIRIMLFIYYSIVVLGDLYYNQGDILFNFTGISSFIRFRGQLFIAIQFIIFIFVLVEIYFKFTNLNYKIKLVKEEDKYKIKISEKHRNISETQQTIRLRKPSSASGGTSSPLKTDVSEGKKQLLPPQTKLQSLTEKKIEKSSKEKINKPQKQKSKKKTSMHKNVKRVEDTQQKTQKSSSIKKTSQVKQMQFGFIRSTTSIPKQGMNPLQIEIQKLRLKEQRRERKQTKIDLNWDKKSQKSKIKSSYGKKEMKRSLLRELSEVEH